MYAQAANISHEYLDEETINALEVSEPTTWYDIVDGDDSEPRAIDLSKPLTTTELLAKIDVGDLDGHYVIASPDVEADAIVALRQRAATEETGYWSGDHIFWIAR